jgi:hypothetical protein
MSKLVLALAGIMSLSLFATGCLTSERRDSVMAEPFVEQTRQTLELSRVLTEAVLAYNQGYSTWPSNRTAFAQFVAQRYPDSDWSMVTNMVFKTDDAGLLHLSYQSSKRDRFVSSNSLSITFHP